MLVNNIVGALLLAFVGGVQTEPAPASRASPERPYAATQLRQAPRSDQDIEDRLTIAQARMAELQQLLVVAPPETTDETATALRSLRESAYQAWEAYVHRLERLKVLKANLGTLTSPEHLSAATEKLTELKRDTDALAQSVTPAAITSEQIQAVEEQIEMLQVHADTLSDAQTRRSQVLATGLQERQEQLGAELSRLRAQREELKKQADAVLVTASPREQEGLYLQREKVDVQAAAVELALEVLPVERQEAELLDRQDARLLDASRKKLEALNRRLAVLRGAQSRSRLETLEIELARATAPIDMALLDLRLLCERALVYYFQRPADIAALQRRFSQRAFERMTERVSLSKTYWDRTIASLQYCSGDEVAGLERQLQEESVEIAKSLATVRPRLARTMDESQTLQTVRETVRKTFSSIADRLATQLTALEMQERAEREGEVTNLRLAVEESMRTAIKAWEDVAGRLNDALMALEQHELYLEDAGRQLRWKRIVSRDSTLIGTNWSAARGELAGLLRQRQTAGHPEPEEVAREAFREQLFGKHADTGAKLRALAHAVRTDLARASTADWTWILTALAGSLVLGSVLHRITRMKGIRLAREIVERYGTERSDVVASDSGLSMRVNLMLFNMVGDTAIPLLLALALVFSAWRLLDDHTLREAALVLLASIAIAITALRLVHHLFEAYSPPHRPIPCTDPVARHYRWWTSLLIVLSLVALPVPMLLNVVDAAPALRSICLETYKACFLAVLLLFVVRKERVLGLGGVRHRHWGIMVVWIIYPLVTVCVALLLLLQLLGFEALVTTVGTGLLLTVGLVVALGAATEYLADIIDRHGDPAPRGPGKPSPGVVDETGDVDETHRRYSIKLLKALVRLAGWAAAILLILWVWDVPIRSEGMAWRKFAFGVLVIVVALVIDRIAFAALHTLYRSGRLPISTVNIIRRWGRGVLTLLVALIVVALAGFKIDSLWTFLTAVLAMVAIGFVAVWSILSNVLATFVILIWRPFNVGERIEVLPEGIEGQVVDINFVYTILKSEDGKRMAIPNNLFAQKFIRRTSVGGAPKRTLAQQLASDQPLD